jgi:hypothetical protein
MISFSIGDPAICKNIIHPSIFNHNLHTCR